jgi:hypothetical protein
MALSVYFSKLTSRLTTYNSRGSVPVDRAKSGLQSLLRQTLWEHVISVSPYPRAGNGS